MPFALNDAGEHGGNAGLLRCGALFAEKGFWVLMRENRNRCKEALWTRGFLSLILSNGLFYAGFHILLPTLPLYALQQGATNAQAGLVAGLFGFAAIFIRLFAEPIAGKWGKKICLFASVAVSCLSAAGYVFLSSPLELMGIRVLHGMGFGIATTLYATIAADLTPASRRGEGMGYFGLGTTVAMAVAPAMGIWIIGGYGFDMMFGIAVVCQLIAFAGLRFCDLPFSRVESPRKAAPVFLRQKCLARGTGFPALLTLLFAVSYGSILSFIAVFAREAYPIRAVFSSWARCLSCFPGGYAAGSWTPGDGTRLFFPAQFQ